MRRWSLIALVGVAGLAGLVLAACGGSARPAPAPVRLTIESPSDGTSTLASQVLVSGVVGPGPATVLVGGRRVAVTGGSFRAHVPIQPGTNVIDVLAGAPRAQAAMSAVRVYRQLPVAIPDVTGWSPSTALATMRRLGLRPYVYDVSGFFQTLLPLSTHVCATAPAVGQSVAPGSEVQLQAAKVC